MQTETRVCSDCQKPFTLCESEQKFYMDRKDDRTGLAWALPKRCKQCRFERRSRRNAPQEANTVQPPAPKKVDETMDFQVLPSDHRPHGEPVKLILAVRDFQDLIRRRAITWRGFTVLLADIGFKVMRQVIDDAEFEEMAQARSKKAN